MVAKLFLLQFYLFGCVIVRLRKMLFAVAGLRPQNILLVFLASLENLKFRYEIVLQPSQCLLNSSAFLILDDGFSGGLSSALSTSMGNLAEDGTSRLIFAGLSKDSLLFSIYQFILILLVFS